MTRIQRRWKLFLALLAGALVVAAGAPLIALAEGTAQFGYKPVRQGIPEETAHFQVSSPDLQNNHPFTTSEIAGIFGCSGGNQAPRLNWSGAPAGTKSFVVTMFDPDAPTGSGFWHWLVWDIPAGTTSLNANLPLPNGVVSGTNDAGLTGYLGPCPPAGDRVHRYQLTVYALNESSLGLPPEVRAAVVGFSMRLNIIGFARLIGTYQRPA